MNNLTTRKIILGLLMTLVLAFGVQGIVNAVLEPTLTPQTNANVIDDRRVGGDF